MYIIVVDALETSCAFEPITSVQQNGTLKKCMLYGRDF